LAVYGQSICAGWETLWLLSKSDSGVGLGWWSDFVLLHHWEASWVNSIHVSEAGSGIWAIWGGPLELGETNCGMSFGWWNNFVLLHHWETGWVESVGISES